MPAYAPSSLPNAASANTLAVMPWRAQNRASSSALRPIGTSMVA